MDPLAHHLLLVSAEDQDNAFSQVENFFNTTLLVRYDEVHIRKDKCFCGTDADFQPSLKQRIDKNRETVDRFFNELEKTGFKTAKDLLRIEYGYPSKLLHIITHFLDGFIGIDSAFYNLIEDSHWISEITENNIKTNPEKYWIIFVDCYSETPEEAALVKH